MSDERQQIEAELAAAATGPWRVDQAGWETEHGVHFLPLLGGGEPGSAPEHCIATVQDYGQGEDQCEADARFIAHAPSNIRSLLDATDTLRTALIEAQSWIEDRREWAYKPSIAILARIREALEGTA